MISVFKNLGEGPLDESNMKYLEMFVCSVYSSTSKLLTVAELRWELFKCKSLEGEKLPPTLGTLKPHTNRANLIAMIWKGYRQPRPIFPSVEECGWEISSDGKIVPTMCLELPGPKAMMELIKCGCKGQCFGKGNCSCMKNSLHCTALCKCNNCSNTKDYECNEAELDEAECD